MSIRVRMRGENAPRSISAEDFAKLFGVDYCPRLFFSSAEVEARVREQCTQLMADGRISTEQQWLGAFYGEQLAEARVAEISIEWISDELGYGVFAGRPFEAGDFLMEYTGVVKPKPFLAWRPKDYSFRYPTAAFFWRKFVIDSEKQGNEARFVNHCDDANAEAVSLWHDGLLHIILRARAPISPGSQIAFDYGPQYWRHRTAPTHLYADGS